MIYYIGQTLQHKDLVADQTTFNTNPDALPDRFVVFSVKDDDNIGLIQANSAPGTLPTWRRRVDLDADFDEVID